MDTNIVIDFLANRGPFAMDVAKLFDLAVNGKIRVFIAAVSYNNIYYILRQSMSGSATLKLLGELADMTEITDDLKNDPTNFVKKYRSIFGAGLGVSWPMEKTFNFQKGITTTSAKQWAKNNIDWKSFNK